MHKAPTKFLSMVVAVALGFALAGGSKGQTTLQHSYGEAVRAAVANVQGVVVQLQPIGGADPLKPSGYAGPVTGIVISTDGDILTSSYGLTPTPASILVVDDRGERTTARIVAIDHVRQLALLRANNPPAFSSLTTGPAPQVGETTIAVGRTLTPRAVNLAVGVLSARNRLHGIALQTDAATSPTNYGGPLIDLRGQIVGIVAPLAPGGDDDMAAGVAWYDSGIGFAVPIEDALMSAQRLREGENLYRGRVGFALAKGVPQTTPPKITAVATDSPGEKVEPKLKKGDLVVAVDGAPTPTVSAFKFAIAGRYAGEEVTLRIKRGEQSFEVSFTLAEKVGELPKEESAVERMLEQLEPPPANPEAADMAPGRPFSPGH